MFTIPNETVTNYNHDIIELENIIVTAKESRPSKSLISCELYTEYLLLNLDLEIFDEYSDFQLKSSNFQLKSSDFQLKSSDFQLKSSDKYSFAFSDILNVFKIDPIDDTISFNTINIYELNDNKNLLVCFETTPTLYNTCYNLTLIVKELSIDDSIVINYVDLFRFPSVEFLILLKIFFTKLKVYYCKILKQTIIYGKKCNSLTNINIFQHIYSKWNKNCNIRQFGIFIDSNILMLVKNFNDYIFSYYLDLSVKLYNLSINDKKYFLKHYIQKQSRTCTLIKDCNHVFKVFNLLDCFICIKCNELFMIY